LITKDMSGAHWGRFRDFIAPNADRFGLLGAFLERAGLPCKTAAIGGNRHIFVAPPPPEESFLRRRPTILVAHYDRAEGSPGANDNSAAVFLLIETALILWKEGTKNWVIIFTDREELKPGESLQNQGSYGLALGLKGTGMENALIFCFDACGAGDTLIISSTADLLSRRNGEGSLMKPLIQELREKALAAARNLRMGKVLLLPTPFSDDAGFLAASVAAQTITMLPSGEVRDLVSVLRKNPQFAAALVNREIRDSQNRRLIPETWRCCNSPSDSHLRLTPQHYRVVVRFACALCRE
jgi:hypothetical protein